MPEVGRTAYFLGFVVFTCISLSIASEIHRPDSSALIRSQFWVARIGLYLESNALFGLVDELDAS